MSGFVGVYNRRNVELTPAGVLPGMTRAMAHRGPHGIGHWHQGAIGLAHCMMQTTPESLQESLPCADIGSGLAITADARIDNRAELGAALGLTGRQKASITDSQLIMQAYRKWASDCVNHLVGDFAFLIWDEHRQQLFGARDHMGVKPFYYHLSDRLFVAASEVRAVRAHPQVPQRRDENRIADFLVDQLEAIDTTCTFYRQILRLPAAHRLTVSHARVRLEKYWKLDSNKELRLGSDEAYSEAFQEVYTEAISARMRCNGQASSMLSGGIDSSSIVRIARDLRKQAGSPPLRVYSGISNDVEKCVESTAIRQVVACGGLESVTVSPAQMVQHEPALRAMMERLEEPFDASMTILPLVYLLAVSNGDRVVLDGADGDMMHSLSICYPAVLLRQGQSSAALRETFGLWKNYWSRNSSPLSVLRYSLVPALVPEPLRRLRRRALSRHLLAVQLEGSAIKPEFCASARLSDRLHTLRVNANSGRLPSSLRELQIRAVSDPCLQAGLERYDRIAALCGTEARHPLLDKRLVELSVSLPWDQKIRRGWSKWQLRKVIEAGLPASVAWRQDWHHLGWSFTEKRMQLLGDTISRKCAKMAPVMENYIAADILEAAAKPGALPESDGQAIWHTYSLAVWLSAHTP